MAAKGRTFEDQVLEFILRHEASLLTKLVCFFAMLDLNSILIAFFLPNYFKWLNPFDSQ